MTIRTSFSASVVVLLLASATQGCGDDVISGGAGGSAASTTAGVTSGATQASSGATSGASSGTSSSSSGATTTSGASSAAATTSAASTTASTTASSSASTGAPMACNPGEARACYSGPPHTAGVGVCASGTETCDANGAGFGPCVGEVHPQLEDCSTPAFESCTQNACTTWAQRWAVGAPSEILIGANGGRVTVGLRAASAFTLPNGLTFGGQVGTVDEYTLIGVDAALGDADWQMPVRIVGGMAPPKVEHLSLAVDDQGRTALGLTYEGTVQLADLSVIGGGLSRSDTVVAQLSTSGAAHWHRRYGVSDMNDDGCDGFDTFLGLALEPDGDVWFRRVADSGVALCPNVGTLYFSNTLLSAVDGSQVTNVTTTGGSGPAWSYSPDAGRAADGNGALVGVHGGGMSRYLPAPGSVSLPGAVDVVLDAAGMAYVVSDTVTKVDTTDAIVWQAGGLPGSRAIALGDGGDVFVFGSPGGVLTVTRMDVDGNVVSTRTFGSGTARDMAIDDVGTIYLTGIATGDIDVGFGPLSGAVGDVFVVKVAP